MVPRPLAAARAMRSCTCADVIQPCPQLAEKCDESQLVTLLSSVSDRILREFARPRLPKFRFQTSYQQSARALKIQDGRHNQNLRVGGSVFHLPKTSGNSGRVVNGTRLFGSFHWKFSGINGIPEKVVPFSRWKLPNGKFVFHLQIYCLYH